MALIKSGKPISGKTNLIIPFYILEIVLPKLVMVYGEAIATVYIQIMLNINKLENVKEKWQKGSSWIQPTTISKKTNYSEKTVYKAIRILEKYKLIIHSKKEKLNIYRMNFLTCDKLIKRFIMTLDFKLALICPLKISLFKKLNNKLKFDFNWSVIVFKDINIVRKQFEKALNIYKGSTLFLLKYILPLQYYNNKIKVSQETMALNIGTSQSTINRYIKAFKDADILVVESNKVNESKTIYIKEKKEEVFVNIYKSCPLCGKNYKTDRGLNSHLSKVDDKSHKLLNQLRKDNQDKPLEELFNQNKIELIKLRRQDIEDWNNSKNDPDSIPNLMRYFYGSLNSIPKNQLVKESSQIKNLFKVGITGDDIRLTMDFLKRQNNYNLCFLNKSIKQATLYKTIINDVNKVGTAEYLVACFYKNRLEKINFDNAVEKVNKAIKDYSYVLTQHSHLNFLENHLKTNISRAKRIADSLGFDYDDSFNDMMDKCLNNIYLMQGKSTNIPERYLPYLTHKITEYFKQNGKVKDGNWYFEILYAAKIPMTQELFDLCLINKKGKFYYERIYNEILNNPVRLNKATSFFNWYNEQVNQFGKEVITNEAN